MKIFLRKHCQESRYQVVKNWIPTCFRSTIVGRKNPNIRKRKQNGSPKKDIKTIHMTLSQVSRKKQFCDHDGGKTLLKLPLVVILQFSISYGFIGILLLLNGKYSINLLYKINIMAIWQDVQRKWLSNSKIYWMIQWNLLRQKISIC